MISFNEKHFHLKSIAEKSGLGKMITKKNYRVFGIKDAEHSHSVEIEYNPYTTPNRNINQVITFLNNKFGSGFIKYKEGNSIFKIALKKSVRADEDKAAKIIKTIVLGAEGRIIWN